MLSYGGTTLGELAMNVLVAYATRHGATAGIAERIADILRDEGFDVHLAKIDELKSLDGYDAFIIGSAAYYFHWLKEASRFIRANLETLRERPVWIFSSGPLGTEKVDADGHDVLKGAEPREFAEVGRDVGARAQRVFFGAFDPDAEPVGLMERFTRKLPAVREALPTGDFRDWTEIERWAHAISSELRTLATRVAVPA
jgi:menaquinone-dependent protoporphyrinogen oxidase